LKPFVHLHVHSDYSFLDGAISIPKLIKKTLEYKMNAVAITDHGNMAGAIEFYKNCTKNGIKPIVGMEAYLAPEGIKEKGKISEFRHLTLLSMNNTGYNNLIKLSSRGFIEGKHWGRARIDLDLLSEHSDGLIALGGCLSGEIPRNILSKDIKLACKNAGIYKEIFNGKFYLELMSIGLEQNDRINRGQIEVSKKVGVGVVATNDVHFLNAEDHEAHEVLLCINTKKTFKDEKRMTSPEEIYFRSADEMWEIFGEIPEALLNTQKIADMCDLKIDLNPSRPYLPKFDIPDGYSSLKNYLESLVWIGAKEKYNNKLSEEVKKRIKFELDIIAKTGYAGYFLMIRDIVIAAKNYGARVGPGRGSAVGSVVLYCLDIISIDPMSYDLLFERFLNPERISAPDIDLDFSDDKRDFVFDYAVKKYGSNAVCHIGTTGTLGAKQVIRDVAKVLGLIPEEINKIAENIPFRIDKPKDDPRTRIQWLYDKDRKFKEAIDLDHRLKKLIPLSSKLEGLKRQPGIHAAGLLIAPGELTDYVPLRKDKNNLIVSQYDMEAIYEVGLIKVDVLGLTALTIIDKTLEILKNLRNVELDIENISLKDKKTYSLLSKGKTTGLFQLESPGMRKLCSRFKPKSIDDIIAIISLYRPGPMDHIDTFIERKNGRKKVDFLHPSLESILKETYGIPIYQEQIMQIANTVAGYNLGRADILRRSMGKKKIEIMKEEKDNFLSQAIERGIKKDIVLKIWDMVEPFAGYGFNKSHGAGYAFLAYYTAYLKAHHTVEFLSATLTSEMSNVDKILIFIEEAIDLGIKILPPSVNFSEVDFKVDGKRKIRYALGAIKNVGTKAAQSIVRIREKNGKYKNFENFLERMDYGSINKRAIEFLIKAGAFDEFEINRKMLFESLEFSHDIAIQKQKDTQIGQLALFGSKEINDSNAREKFNFISWSFTEKLEAELESYGFYFSAHPLEEYSKYIKLEGLETISYVKRYKAVSHLLAGLVTNIEKTKFGCFLRLEDNNSEIGVNIPKTLLEKVENITISSVVALKGKIKKVDGNDTFITEKISKLDDIIKNNIKSLEIKIPTEKMDDDTLKQIKTLIGYNNGKFSVNLEIRSRYGPKVRLKSKMKVCFEKNLPFEIDEILEQKGYAYYKANINS